MVNIQNLNPFPPCTCLPLNYCRILLKSLLNVPMTQEYFRKNITTSAPKYSVRFKNGFFILQRYQLELYRILIKNMQFLFMKHKITVK